MNLNHKLALLLYCLRAQYKQKMHLSQAGLVTSTFTGPEISLLALKIDDTKCADVPTIYPPY